MPMTRSSIAISARSLRRAGRQECGQTLIIVVLCMFAIIAIAGLAIDVSTWYQKHHQAQVAADAAALAAANCMANVGSTATGTATNACTTATDTSDAKQVATTLASDNGVTLSASQVNLNTVNSTVTVTASEPTSSFFARFLPAPTQQATAVATWNAASIGNCSSSQQSASSCYLAFAYNSNCSNAKNGVYNTANNTTYTGPVHSNANIDNAGNGNTKFLGPNTYGPGTSGTCSSNVTATKDSSGLCYPIDYSGLTPNPSSCRGQRSLARVHGDLVVLHDDDHIVVDLHDPHLRRLSHARCLLRHDQISLMAGS